MSAATSYNHGGTAGLSVQGEVEYAADPASGAFFQPDFKKNDDLKMMLDSSKDTLKLEAMKRIIGMIAKGRDASDLFPAVVKNVVSKNIEVKKLVYVYLVRYAEEQQDLALLSISTFQRALKDPNQLIRASALRVLSSIRVSMIVPIVMLAIRDSASDMSPYVRKTAAHAIPKLYSLDPSQKEELVGIIDKLVSDRAPLVVGSAAMAFTEVCPERSSLLHRSYRKLCSLLLDVDEWGQVALLHVLTRYAREHFCDPNVNNEIASSESETEKPFYEESDSDKSDSEKKEKKKKSGGSVVLEADHKLLLRATRPLLQSRNSAVVMAVAQLYYHAAPSSDLALAAKAMIRLLRGPFEVQSVVLHSIASLTISKRSIFEPYLKSFFVRTSDPTHIKLLKLEILTSVANETSASVILRELQTYVRSPDKAFAAATIQAIGRIAMNVHKVTETCLNGLLQLLSSKDEWIAGEAVVVAKGVVGVQGGARTAVERAARLLLRGRLCGAPATAAALWLVTEHGADLPVGAALVAHYLGEHRFSNQDEVVKLQLLSLAVKLSVRNPETLPLARYMLTLARYDACYDVRDRARLLRHFVEPKEGGRLARHAAEIFLAEKPVALVESKFKDVQQYTLGSLSHLIGARAEGYTPLPAFPEQTQGARERDPEVEQAVDNERVVEDKQKQENFYSEAESGTSGSDSASGSSGESSDEEEQSDGVEKTKNNKNAKGDLWNATNSRVGDSKSETSDSESDSSSSSESTTSEESSGESPHEQRNQPPPKEAKVDPTRASKPEKSNLDLLLELDEVASTLPILTPSYGGFLSPTQEQHASDDVITPVSASFVEQRGRELLSRLSSRGLSARYRWTRAPHLASDKMAAVEVTLANHTADTVCDVAIVAENGSRSVHEFSPIPFVAPGGSVSATLGLQLNDTIQPVNLTLRSSLGSFDVSVSPSVGELLRAVSMSEQRWLTEQKKLRGIMECDKKVTPADGANICQRVFEAANVACISSTGDIYRFSGRLLSSQELVLLSVARQDGGCHVTANCSNMAVASLITDHVANALTSQ